MKIISSCLATVAMFLLTVASLPAMVKGPCSDCHTMHNSQDGSPLNFDASETPNRYLTRGNCAGCHAQQGSTRVISLNDSQIPQVMHTDAIDLAGGNFNYVFGSAGDDAKGHNVIDLGAADQTLLTPPGSYHGDPESNLLTCAGSNDCHGSFGIGYGDPYTSLVGAHHRDDSTISGASVGESYRFLKGVVGLEAPDWENKDSENHNEYHGHDGNTIITNCSGCHAVHAGEGGLPAGSPISDICVRCHYDMHQIDPDYNGVWIRHPYDTIIPDDSGGEYQDYTVYNVEAPVGRVIVPATASSVVTPGTDVVTCLSCHVAHASNYPDLLRWDYSLIIANGGSNQNGCFICHTTKDQ